VPMITAIGSPNANGVVIEPPVCVAAVRNVAFGPSRHFAAVQQSVALGGNATVREECLIAFNLCTRARYGDTGSISVGSSSRVREARSWQIWRNC
jgi:hypothetical protein